VRGLVESVFKAKKYELPLLALHPVVGGTFAAAYLAGGRFNPGQSALMFSAEGDWQLPLSDQDRRAYLKGLEEVTRSNGDVGSRREEASWERLLEGAQLKLDASGQPVLQVRSGTSSIEVGIARGNVFSSDAPREVTQQLLVARLREQLRGGRSPKTSEVELRKDWKLLKTAFADEPHSNATRNNTSDAVETMTLPLAMQR
jgi:hypothetical protein